MTEILVRCPNAGCGASYRVDESLRGKTGRCTKCGQKFLLQPPEPAAPAEDNVAAVWQPGDVILDLYEVKGVLGEGGMGTVYRVHHKGWNRDLAVKSVKADLLARQGALDNFEREAETWVNLNLHPHNVSCYYVRRLGGLPRIFAEFIEGGTLQDWINGRNGQPAQLYADDPDRALERILDIAIQFAWGLHSAHEQGLIHQDVKPANVMMTQDGIAKVTDFGLARARALAGEVQPRAAVGQSILVSSGGMTPAYCSPEQAHRLPLSRKTDLWSWAVSVLEMFTGDVTWPSGTVVAESLEAYLEMGAGDERIPPMPAGLAGLLRRCLQNQPEARPRDMLEVVESLRSVYRDAVGQDYPREKPNPAEALADTLNNRAVSLFDLGKKAEAEQKWQEALSVDPLHPEATYNWGLVQWRSLRLTDLKLLERLREARASSVDPARVDYLLGLVHLERTDAQAAVHWLSKASEAGTGRTEITVALALAQSLADPSNQLPAFEGHTDGVKSVSFSPDGRLALSGSHDKTLRLWEVSTGTCLRIFEGHTDWVKSVSFSPDGRLALSGSHDKTLRLWEPSSGRCLRAFKGHTESVKSVSFSPDGRLALSGSDDRTLRLWEVSTGKDPRSGMGHLVWAAMRRLWQVSRGQCLRTFLGHTWDVTSVAWGPDGRFALSGSRDVVIGSGESPTERGVIDNSLRLWEVSSGRCLRTFEGHTSHVNAVAWGPDGRWVLSGSDDHTVELWEVSSGRCLRTFEGHTRDVESVAFSPDGRFALSGSVDKTLRLWELSSGQCLRTFEGHTGEVYSVTFSPDGRLALSGSGDRTLRLWGVAFARQPVGLVTSMAFGTGSRLYHHVLQQARDSLPSNPAAAAGYLQRARQHPGCSRREEALELARLLSHSLAHRHFVEGWEKRTFEGHTGIVTSVSFSPDGRLALSGSKDKTLRLWELSTGKCLRTFEGHTDEVTSVSFCPDGLYALSGSEDRTLRLWEVSTGKCPRTFKGHTARVSSVAWSSDGRYALSGGNDDTLRLWVEATGYCLRTFEGHTSTVTSLTFSPDGRCALSGSVDQTLRLWEVSSGRCLRTFTGHTKWVYSVAWSPDGRYALSGSEDKTLRLWELSSGQCLRTFEGHTGIVDSVSFSPDGRYALSGSRDKTLRLWEVSTGKCLRTFEGHLNWVKAVSWGPDGRHALSGSWDKTLRLWELDWEFEPNQPADWDEGARPFLDAFLTLHTFSAEGMVRRGKASWTEDDFRRLLDRLGCAGYGWLRPEGVRRELETMAARWQGPPPLREQQ